MFDDDVLVSTFILKLIIISKERRRRSIKRKIRVMRRKIRRFKRIIKIDCL